MALTKLNAFLARHSAIALDTSIFIYQFEEDARYVSFTHQIFSWLERRDAKGLTSTITMAELLVQPYRNLNQAKVDEFYGLLATYPNLAWIAPNLEIADLAARFRAQHGLRTPDALQAATAVHEHATGIITNDPVFARLPGLDTLILDHLL